MHLSPDPYSVRNLSHREGPWKMRCHLEKKREAKEHPGPDACLKKPTDK